MTTWLKLSLCFLIRVSMAAHPNSDRFYVTPKTIGVMHMGINTILPDLDGFVEKALESLTSNLQYSSFSMVKLKHADLEDSVLMKNVSFILSTAHCKEVEYIERIAEFLQIPIIIFSDDGCMPVRTGLVHQVPVFAMKYDLPEMMREMIGSGLLDINDLRVIFDTKFDTGVLDLVCDVIRINSGHNAIFSLHSIYTSGSNTSAEARENLEWILSDKKREHQILLMTTRMAANIILREARKLNMMVPGNRWLFVFDETTDIDNNMLQFVPDVGEGENVAFVYNNSMESNICKEQQCLIETILSSMMRAVEMQLAIEWRERIEVHQDEWREIQPSEMERSLNYTKMMRMFLGQENRCLSCRSWQVESVEIGDRGVVRLIDVADWTLGWGLATRDSLFPHVTGKFRGRTLRVLTIEYPPWQIYIRDNAGNVVGYTGVVFQIVKEMAAALNFTFVVTEPADGSWGVEVSPGQWNGMVREVANGEVQLAAAAFTVSSRRRSVVNFTMQIDRQPYNLMSARPVRVARTLLFLEPYAIESWWCILAAVLLSGPILWLINNSSYYYKYHKIERKRGLFTLYNCSLYTFGAIVQQGGTKLPQSLSARFLVGMWWLFVIVVLTTYSGNLVAVLTFPQVVNAIDSISDIIQNRHSITWGVLGGTAIATYFKESPDPKYALIFGDAIIHNDETDQEILDMVYYENHVFIEWKAHLDFLMKEDYLKTNKCRFSLGREQLFEELVAMIVPPNTPYLDLFNGEINKMLKGGLIDRWKQEFWPKEDECSISAYGGKGAQDKVNMDDMQGSFFLLFLGIAAGLIILIGECFARYCCRFNVGNKDNNNKFLE